MMSTKQSLIHNETIWKSTYLRNFLSLDLVNWSINIETGESCCLKWSFSLTLCEIPWRFSSILPNVKTSLTLCKIPWQFPDLEKFYFSLTFPWRLWTLFHSHQWIKTKVTVRKRSIRVKIGDFLSRVTLKFDGWPWKTLGHLFYATSSSVYHFITICGFKLELRSGNS